MGFQTPQFKIGTLLDLIEATMGKQAVTEQHEAEVARI